MARAGGGWASGQTEAEADPSVIPRLARVLLPRSAGERGQAPAVVGEAGFHGAPGEDGRVEIGYMVVSEYRRGLCLGGARAAVVSMRAAGMGSHHATTITVAMFAMGTMVVTFLFTLPSS